MVQGYRRQLDGKQPASEGPENLQKEQQTSRSREAIPAVVIMVTAAAHTSAWCCRLRQKIEARISQMGGSCARVRVKASGPNQDEDSTASTC